MAGLTVTDLFLAGRRARKAAEEPPPPDNPLFDRAFYAETNPHVVKGGIDLHLHYAHFGCRNGYDPNAYFHSAWYRTEYPDVKATGANPLDHYLERGAIEGRNPSPLFSTWLYMLLYPDVRASGMNPLLHYLVAGKAEGRLAPPVCLVPSLAAMQGPVEAQELPRTAEAAAVTAALRVWLDKLAEAGRPGGQPEAGP